ncbi:Voltage-gated hydrogen channel 1 [Mactra antiquata]
MLILVCCLVTLECMCVIAELMVDLHGIRVIFNQEEQELKKFIDVMHSENNCTRSHGLETFSDILDLMSSINSHKENSSKLCQRRGFIVHNNLRQNKTAKGKNSAMKLVKSHLDDLRRRRRYLPSAAANNLSKRDTSNAKSVAEIPSDQTIFLFSLYTSEENYFIISTFEEMSYSPNKELPKPKNMNDYRSEYEKIQTISHTIKYVGFFILSIMTLEVFDAFIVLISFVLDVVFIDSKWYETGKDVTTVLVLLLPWRIVRIINSFVMTINHKHHIQIMTVRQSKKKVVMKLKKLQHLMLEMRRDVDHLITLSKSKGATDPEVFNCIYGRGRGTKSLSAITSFASLMFISTLGQDLDTSGGCNSESEDMYGELIRNILEQDDDADDGRDDTDNDKTTSDDKDIYIELPCTETESPTVTENAQSNMKSSIKKEKDSSTSRITRRVTLPRRLRSCSDDDDKPVFFINDAYDIEDDVMQNKRQKSISKRKRTVQSLPHIYNSVRGKNFVTFEVTTQVTYL